MLNARGSVRAKQNRREPEAIDGLPDPPKWMNAESLEVWHQLIADLSTMRVLSKSDWRTIARYCRIWDEWRRADKWIEDKGAVYTIKDENGKAKCVVQWPQVAMVHKFSAAMLLIEREFGLTPASRTRIVVNDGQEKTSKDRFFSGPKLAAG